MIQPDKIVEAISQVRDSDVEASEYDFLNEGNIHPAPRKKGNDGLSNWIANLAVYEENGETKVDQGLVEEADDILAEQQGADRGRTRIANIVHDSENRPGQKLSLEDNDVNGHERLLEMAEEFYKETGKKDKLENILDFKSSLSECNNDRYGNDAFMSKPENQPIPNGGETMTKIEEMAADIEERVDEIYGFIDSLPGEETYDDLRSNLDELTDLAEAARDDYFEVRDELADAGDELEEVYNALDSAHKRVEEANEYVRNAETAMGHALEDKVSDIESALDEGQDQLDDAQNYMKEILDDDVPDTPSRPDRVEEQLN